MGISRFKNEKYLNFADNKISAKQKAAIKSVESKFGKEYPLIINGEEVLTEKKFNSINPSNKSEVVGIFQKATKELAEKAINVAVETFETWKKEPAKKRAEYLFKAAKIVRKRRLEINAWMISEVGKSYIEADADTAEAIDFLEFYAREALRYDSKQPLVKVKGEQNRLKYIPLGVGVIIPPWNFPFAILVGMTSAAIVSGNTVLLKPSSDSPMMGWLFHEIMKEAGLPKGVLNFVPGSGAEVGDTFTTHPKTRFIAFTGSKEVGLHIVELASKHQPGQIWIKRVVAEMGGKDSIIVDKDTDLNVAAEGVVAAAYGFQGQKCSACSRAIVHQKVYDKFVSSLKEKVDALKQGPAKDNYRVGPVVSKNAFESIMKYIEIGKKEGKLLCGGSALDLNGFYIQPTVFIDIDPMARISQEEIFGPVLAVIKAKDFNHAMEIANNTEYGLTGALYSNNKKHIERAKEEFHVGNLYLNRKCTGALVGVQPFGGFNMSGTDSKAGGRDYLMLFTQAKVWSEKIEEKKKKK